MKTAACLATLLLAGCGSASSPEPSADADAAPAIRPVAAATQPVGSGTDDPAALAHYDGYGDMRFGMDTAAATRAWGGELKGGASGNGCQIRTPKWVANPRQFGFMFDGGRFVRYDVATTKEPAPGGGRVGMDAAQVRALYGQRIETRPDKYVAGAQQLRIAAPTGSSALVFDTGTDGKVIRWHVGVPPQVDYVEGCG